jgi:hypothetical protein
VYTSVIWGEAVEVSQKNGLKSTDFPERCRVAFDELAKTIFDRLLTETERNGGLLRAPDVERLKLEIMDNNGPVSTTARAVCQEAAFTQVGDRINSFHRLIVSRFEDLFLHNGGGDLEQDELSRQFLPGFFVAVEKMLGGETIKEYQDKCENIVTRLLAERGDAFSWQDVYQDEEANEFILDPLIAIACYFEEIDKRANWFIELVNGQISPSTAEKGDEAETNWHLSEPAFYRFLDTMFSSVRGVVSGAGNRPDIKRRYGEKTLGLLSRVMGQLDQHVSSKRKPA